MTADEIYEIEFFSGLPEWAISDLARSAERFTFEPGDLIIEQHDKATQASFLISGEVQALLRFEGMDDLIVETIGNHGALLGWSIFRPPYRYTAAIRCAHNCTILSIARTAFEDVFERDPQIAYEVLHRAAAALADRLADTQSKLLGSAYADSADPS